MFLSKVYFKNKFSRHAMYFLNFYKNLKKFFLILPLLSQYYYFLANILKIVQFNVVQ